MTSEKVIRTALTICLFLSLFSYHLLAALIKPDPSGAYFDVFKIAQITVTLVVFFLLVNSELLSRVFLRDKFIGGAYEGESKAYRRTEPQAPDNHVEVFVITQNLFEAQVSGKSLKKDSGELISLWSGRLFRVEGNRFYFAVELSTEKGEFGVLQASFDGDKVHGFYYSGEPRTTHAFSISATKIDKKRQQRLKLKSA